MLRRSTLLIAPRPPGLNAPRPPGLKASLVSALVAACAALAPAAAHAGDAAQTPAWKKEKNILEVGWMLGALFPAADHGLYANDKAPNPARAFKTGFDIGLRFAYMPFRFFGVEIEGDLSPTRVDRGEKRGARSYLYGARGHVILQLPTQLSLFVLAGGGMLGGSSKDNLIGKNVDGAVHVGAGLKYYVNKYVVLRIDGRDVMTQSYAKLTGGTGPAFSHSIEFTFGASFVWGRKSPKMLPKG